MGKSSLLNRLLRRKALARISSTPGRTRAINYFLINESFYFVDLPGYGYAKVSKSERQAWAGLMESYFSRVADRGMVVQIVDAKVGATSLDVQASEYLEALRIQRVVVATKTDRLSRNKAAQALGAIRRDLGERAAPQVVAFSAQTGFGVKELWVEIDRYLEAASRPS